MTGWEDAIVAVLVKVFGSQQVLGIIAILVSTLFIVVMKPPEVVAMVAVGLIILLIASSFLGGYGAIPMLFIGVAIAFSILAYFAYKRVGRDY
jgi:hypothetical protein